MRYLLILLSPLPFLWIEANVNLIGMLAICLVLALVAMLAPLFYPR